MKYLRNYLHISWRLLRSNNFLQFFFDFFKKRKKIAKHKSVVRTVLLEVGIVLGILKKSYLKVAILF